MKNRISISFAAVALLTAAFTFSAAAQDKTKWTGTWKMAPAKSKFNGNGPASIVIKLELKDGAVSETMTVSNDNGDRSFSATYTTDGKESEQEVMGRTAKTSAKWEGNVLVIEFKAGEGSFIRKISLSEDGKTMSIAVHQSSGAGGQGDSPETVVLEKQ